jgi:uncharacterized Zn finger protein (UPF0148 family)
MICNLCDSELIKVGDFYRCENCDLYCPECGALIFEDETTCPYCFVEFEFVDDEEETLEDDDEIEEEIVEEDNEKEYFEEEEDDGEKKQ